MHVPLSLSLLGLIMATSEVASLTIVSRSEWGAVAPKKVTRMRNVPGYVIIHHSDTPTCEGNGCKSRIQNIQSYHMKTKGWDDIGYNFLVTEDGKVYEGVGWGNVGTQAPQYNSRSIGIVFIGTYNARTPNAAAINAAKELISWAVANNKVTPNYKLLGHRQVRSTDCPGNALYNDIQSWAHWSSTP